MAQDRFTTAQRRLLVTASGLVVAVLAGGAFVLTYDVLRELAVAGRAGKRWAPVYPVMADALTVMTILSLVVTRHARWWSRGIRWILLLVLLGGVAAISVQRSLRGYDSLPDEPLRAGVAVAPHAMLVIAVWLWLTLFKQLRAKTPATVKEEAESAEAAPPAPPKEPDLIPFPHEEDEEEERAEESEEDGDPEDTAPLPGVPTSLPTDVELVRTRPAPPDPAKTTRPDIVVPANLDAAEDETELGPLVDRAEDPDAGDDDEHSGRGRHRLRRDGDGPPEPTSDDDDERIWDWHPPSSTFRSSPTPPAD